MSAETEGDAAKREAAVKEVAWLDFLDRLMDGLQQVDRRG